MIEDTIATIAHWFGQFGFPLRVRNSVLPPVADRSTLFLCSGMQAIRSRFDPPDHGSDGSVQRVIRTKDLEFVGDGAHLSGFRMIGNFSFGNNDFERSVELWTTIVHNLRIPVSQVRVHPTRYDHRDLWAKRGFAVTWDPNCTWTDGRLGGECCELFVGDLEIGNLVNTLGHSTDVGFGLERIQQVIEGKKRVDETSVFDQSLDPVARDHVRTLRWLREDGVTPGAKGRSSVCRRLIRRILDSSGLPSWIDDWVIAEYHLRCDKVERARRKWRKFSQQPPSWWYETYGIYPEELRLVADAH